jgi:hypothetical protein
LRVTGIEDPREAEDRGEPRGATEHVIAAFENVGTAWLYVPHIRNKSGKELVGQITDMVTKIAICSCNRSHT